MRVAMTGYAGGLLLLVAMGLSACGGDGGSDFSGSFAGSGNPPTLPPDPGNDGDSVFLNVVPPGANGNSNVNVQGIAPLGEVRNFQDQLRLYEELAFSPENLKAAPCTPPQNTSEHAASDRSLVCSHFKHAGLTPDSVVSEHTLANPATGGSVKITRDGWGVPFVVADTRQDAMFGLGFASAQDRLFLHDALRHIGRGRLSEFLGPEASFFAFDVDIANAAGYSEAELTRMVERTQRIFGPLGEIMISDIDNMVAGINAYLASLQTVQGLTEVPLEYLSIGLPNLHFPPAPWTRNDIVASAILIQGIFAVGGGSEHLNLLQLQTSDPSFGAGATTIPRAACEIWRDLRHALDPDTPSTTQRSFATQSPVRVSESCPQSLPAGAAIWDPGSFQGRTTLRVTNTNLPVPIPQLPGPLAAAGISLAPLGDLLGTVGGLLGGGALSFGNALPLSSNEPQPRWLPRSLEQLLADAAPAAGARVPYRSAGAAVHTLVASLNPVGDAREHLCAAGICLPQAMSNFIGVRADQTTDRFPLVVMGPQTGYFLAQLLWEVAIISGGSNPGPLDFAGRGVVFGDLPYINIGRGLDYAWSATSGSSDIIDTRVSMMCNLDGSPAARSDANGDGFPDADGYIYNGKCRPFVRRLDSWNSSPTVASVASGGSPTLHRVERFVLRTHYGPVFATATVNGAPVAISQQRATFFGELDTAPPFALVSARRVDGFDRFRKLFNSVTGTFNWLYVDGADLGYFHSGLYPQRHPQAHPELPVWGDGRFEWAGMRNLGDTFFAQLPYQNTATPVAQGNPLDGFFEWSGFLPLNAHPQETNPPEGYLVSWNNNPAKDWYAADGSGSYGPIHRADILDARMAAFKASGRKHDIASMVEIMSDAAHTDLRGQEVIPHVLAILRQPGSPAPLTQAALEQIIALLDAWSQDGSLDWIQGGEGMGLGGYRRDRNRDGAYDHRAAVVLMDAWYPEMIARTLPQVAALENTPHGNLALQGRDNPPGATGSAYINGFFQIMDRVYSDALDRQFGSNRSVQRYRALRCAGANAGFAQCRSALLEALGAAVTRLGGVQNIANWDGTQLYTAANDTIPLVGGLLLPPEGQTVEAHDAIRHTAISAGSVPPMHWANRPTFQQVVQPKGRKPR